MDIGSILLILALLLFIVFFVSQPFTDRRRPAMPLRSEADDQELSSLLAERDRVLNALQELDFDYTLGKIPEEDYPAQRARMLQYGAEVLRQIDELQGAPVAGASGTQSTGAAENLAAEARIEATVAARRADAARSTSTFQPAATSPGSNGGKVVSVAVAAPDDEMEILLANRRRDRQDEAAGFCPKCGTALQKSDKFCPKCGYAL